VGDNSDVFPHDQNESKDSDCDGIGDNTVIDFGDEIRLSLGTGIGIAHKMNEVGIGLNEGEVLSANGSTAISINIVEQSCDFFASSEANTVHFSSYCTQLGLAEFIPFQVAATSAASSTYVDKGCGQESGRTDNIFISVTHEDDERNISTRASVITELDIGAAQVGAIQFVNAMPVAIAIEGQGSESTPSSTLISFKVVDFSDNPMPNRTVNFELDNSLGGAVLARENYSTDSVGIVKVFLIAGHTEGSLRVKASIDVLKENGDLDFSISTLSDPIRVVISSDS
jgi:hypothetical protein